MSDWPWVSREKYQQLQRDFGREMAYSWNLGIELSGLKWQLQQLGIEPAPPNPGLIRKEGL